MGGILATFRCHRDCFKRLGKEECWIGSSSGCWRIIGVGGRRRLLTRPCWRPVRCCLPWVEERFNATDWFGPASTVAVCAGFVYWQRDVVRRVPVRQIHVVAVLGARQSSQCMDRGDSGIFRQALLLSACSICGISTRKRALRPVFPLRKSNRSFRRCSRHSSHGFLLTGATDTRMLTSMVRSISSSLIGHPSMANQRGRKRRCCGRNQPTDEMELHLSHGGWKH